MDFFNAESQRSFNSVFIYTLNCQQQQQFGNFIKTKKRRGDSQRPAFDAEDSYRMSSFKVLFAMRIFLEECYFRADNASFKLKPPIFMQLDGDVFINPLKVWKLIENLYLEAKSIWSAGFVWENPIWGPNRDRKSRHFLPEEIYPDSKLPNYINGPAFFLSSESVKMIFLYELCLPSMLPIHDVELGIVLHKLKIPMIHLNSYITPFPHKACFLDFAKSGEYFLFQEHAILHTSPPITVEDAVLLWNLFEKNGSS